MKAAHKGGVNKEYHHDMFPAVSGRSGEAGLFHGGAEFDLELVESTVLDGRTHKLVYVPRLHGDIPEGVGPKRRIAD